MRGKWIITNTTTAADVELARSRGVELLVTSTPRLEGRSFGTNVIEATMVALDGAKGELSPERYRELLDSVGFQARRSLAPARNLTQAVSNKTAERKFGTRFAPLQFG